MTTHELKIWPEYYDAILDGRKRFELRKADRPYKVGDTLLLKEWHPLWEKYTGRECLVKITYILEGQHAVPGYCLMSIEWLDDYSRLLGGMMTLPKKCKDCDHLTLSLTPELKMAWFCELGDDCKPSHSKSEHEPERR